MAQFKFSETNCTPPAIDDFPADIFTREQRQAGAVAFHIAVSLYLFLALAVVCDRYFVPAVEKICQGMPNRERENCDLIFLNYFDYFPLESMVILW